MEDPVSFKCDCLMNIGGGMILEAGSVFLINNGSGVVLMVEIIFDTLNANAILYAVGELFWSKPVLIFLCLYQVLSC